MQLQEGKSQINHMIIMCKSPSCVSGMAVNCVVNWQ